MQSNIKPVSVRPDAGALKAVSEKKLRSSISVQALRTRRRKTHDGTTM
jgi:hypothetical protein